MQLLQVGLSSPHLMRRLRHVRHPVLVLFRDNFEPVLLEPGSTSSFPSGLLWAVSTVSGNSSTPSMLMRVGILPYLPKVPSWGDSRLVLHVSHVTRAVDGLIPPMKQTTPLSRRKLSSVAVGLDAVSLNSPAYSQICGSACGRCRRRDRCSSRLILDRREIEPTLLSSRAVRVG